MSVSGGWHKGFIVIKSTISRKNGVFVLITTIATTNYE